MLSSTPAAKYDQRQNRGGVVCTLNDAFLPRSWRGTGSNVTIAHYDSQTALKSPYQYMFQKVSEKALSKFYPQLLLPSLTLMLHTSLVPRPNHTHEERVW